MYKEGKEKNMIIYQCQLSFCTNHEAIGDTCLCMKHYKSYWSQVKRHPETTLKQFVHKAEMDDFMNTLGECLIEGCHTPIPRNHKKGLCKKHIYSYRKYYKQKYTIFGYAALMKEKQMNRKYEKTCLIGYCANDTLGWNGICKNHYENWRQFYKGKMSLDAYIERKNEAGHHKKIRSI